MPMRLRMGITLAALAACLAFSPGDVRANTDYKTQIVSIDQQQHGSGTAMGLFVTDHSATAPLAALLDQKIGAQAKHEHQPVLARNKGDDLGATMASALDSAYLKSSIVNNGLGSGGLAQMCKDAVALNSHYGLNLLIAKA